MANYNKWESLEWELFMPTNHRNEPHILALVEKVKAVVNLSRGFL